MDTEKLEQSAREIMQIKRNSVRKPGFLVPEPPDRKWRTKVADSNISKESLVKDAIKPKTINPHSSTRDLDTFGTFLSINKKDNLCLPSSVKMKDAIPVGVPILDFVSVENSIREDVCKVPPAEEIKIYQQNRGCSYNSLYPIDPKNEVCIKEILIGISSRKEILSAHKWLKQCLKADSDIFPHGTTSFNVKDIKIAKHDLDAVFGAKGSEDWVPTTPKSKLTKGDSLVRFPTKICIGSGLRFALIITWPVTRIKSEFYRIYPTHIQDEVIDLLNDLPSVVGVGIQVDVKVVEEIFSKMSRANRFLSLNWIGIDCLALLCGYRLEATNVPALALNVVGGLMDKMSSAADGRWHEEWKDLPLEFQIYVIKDLQFSSICYNTLATVFVRDIAPDMEAWCFLTDMDNHHAAVEQILEWVRFSLSKTEIWRSPDPVSNKEQLLKCIRSRNLSQTSTGGRVRFSPPLERVMIWSDLMGPWSPLTEGGPRWLHQVRNHVSNQGNILSQTKDYVLPKAKELISKDSELTLIHLTFEQPKLEDLFFRREATKFGLIAHPNLKCDPIEVDMLDMQPKQLVQLAESQGRSMSSIIFEQARLHPKKIDKFLELFVEKNETLETLSEGMLYQVTTAVNELHRMQHRIFGHSGKPIIWKPDVQIKDGRPTLKRAMKVDCSEADGSKISRSDVKIDKRSEKEGSPSINYISEVLVVEEISDTEMATETRIVRYVDCAEDVRASKVDHLPIGEESDRKVEEGTSSEENNSRPPTPFPFMYTDACRMIGVPVETPPVGPVVINRSPSRVEEDSNSSTDSSSSEDSDSSSSSSSSDDQNLDRLKKLHKKIKLRISYLESKKERRTKKGTKEGRPVEEQDFFKYLDDYEKELK